MHIIKKIKFILLKKIKKIIIKKLIIKNNNGIIFYRIGSGYESNTY